MKIDRKKALKLAVTIVICQMAGIIGSVFTAPNVGGWYADIAKPWFTPPGWLFAPAWTTLFVLMGISLYLAYENKAKIGLYLFGVQLSLNVLWSALFFGMQNPFLAFAEIVMLWFAILATILAFYKSSKKAAYLLVPYLAWVTFASVLNYSVWMLNA